MISTERNSPPARFRISRLTLGCLAALALLAPTAAFAYLDPSTGSMVVSAIVGIFASIALAVKTYWYKIKAFFKRGSGSEAARPSQQESDTRESTD